MSNVSGYIDTAVRTAEKSFDYTGARLFSSATPRIWFELGLVAWLAMIHSRFRDLFQIVKSASNGSFLNFNLNPTALKTIDPNAVSSQIWLWILGHGLYIALFIISSAAVYLTLLWISSVAEFIFLDNLAQRKTTISSSWPRFVRRGFSFFIWRLLLRGLFLLITITIAAVGTGLSVAITSNVDTPSPVIIVIVVLALLILLTGALACASLTNFLLCDIAVPLMYKFDLTGRQAVVYVISLLKIHWVGMVAAWMMQVILKVGVHITLAIAVICTLCLALVPMMIPVVNIAWGYLLTVLLLPVHVFFRAYGPTFLELLNPSYKII